MRITTEVETKGLRVSAVYYRPHKLHQYRPADFGEEFVGEPAVPVLNKIRHEIERRQEGQALIFCDAAKRCISVAWTGGPEAEIAAFASAIVWI